MFEDDSSSVSANFPGKPVCECMGTYGEIDNLEPTREACRLGHTRLARPTATMQFHHRLVEIHGWDQNFHRHSPKDQQEADLA